MIELRLNEEQKILQEMAKKFCQQEIAPHLEALENHQMHPYDIIKKYIKTLTPAEEIRTVEDAERLQKERDFIGNCLVAIELSKVSPGIAMSAGVSLGLTAGTIMKVGTREQKGKYALPLLRGDKIGCWAMTEPEAGSDVIGIKSTAKWDGNFYILNGSKTFITNAPYADIMVVYAKTNLQAPGHRGMSAFVLERGMEGLSTGEPMDKMGMRSSPTGEIFMDALRVTKEQLLGTEDRAFYESMMTFNEERAGAPVIAIGIIERCLEESIKYATQRVQFGQNIAFFQAIQFKLARMYTALQNCYGMLFMLAELVEQGKDITAFASAAKLYSSEAATQCALEAIQIHGGYGYMKEYKVERFMRDAKLLEIGAGTSEIQQLIIARELLRGTAPPLNPLFAPPDPFKKEVKRSWP